MNKEKVTKRLSNEGFSLVELIIVIAIMAVLVGVITPQYIKYVNKSKYGVDVQTMDSLRNAMNIIALDPTVIEEPISGPIAATEIGSGIGTNNDVFWREVYGIMGVATTETVSGATQNRSVTSMTADVKKMLKLDQNGVIKYSYSNGNFIITVSEGKYTGSYAITVQ